MGRHSALLACALLKSSVLVPLTRLLVALPLQEWLTFVDREKIQRQIIEQRVAHVAEDAADLRAWTVTQVRAGGQAGRQRFWMQGSWGISLLLAQITGSIA